MPDGSVRELVRGEGSGGCPEFSVEFHVSLAFRGQYLPELRVLLFHCPQYNLPVFCWSMREAGKSWSDDLET